jgi:hypothetical protein
VDIYVRIGNKTLVVFGSHTVAHGALNELKRLGGLDFVADEVLSAEVSQAA